MDTAELVVGRSSAAGDRGGGHDSDRQTDRQSGQRTAESEGSDGAPFEAFRSCASLCAYALRRLSLCPLVASLTARTLSLFKRSSTASASVQPAVLAMRKR